MITKFERIRFRLVALSNGVNKRRYTGRLPLGRYTCLKCTKFSGPRKAVEDHCRQKHKLIGKKLESAVGISDEEKTTETNTTSSDKSKDVNKRKKVEMTEGPKSNVMDAAETPERGSKRIRSTSDPADDMDKAAKRNHEGEPIEETPVTPQEADEIDTEKCDTSEETREQGKPSVEAPDSTETSGRTDGQHESSNQKQTIMSQTGKSMQ
ncbi:hypothetical protein BSL78_10641 [Apostichopus japonicus]|uniref:Uncharacterized protein n=1 Tax=Stichopus japonicus TaxID=307972 RepID=A0A2G8KWV0_STIJA|nr:hypothetical protein BSL78_10641 [Apostichopus japonicus]